MIGWLYIREGMTGNEQIGPFTDPQIAELATTRKIGRATAIAHPTKTRGQWVSAEEIPALARIFDAYDESRRKPKQGVKSKIISTEIIENTPEQIPRSIQQSPSYPTPSAPQPSPPVPAAYQSPQAEVSPFGHGHAPAAPAQTTIVVHNQAFASAKSGDPFASGCGLFVAIMVIVGALMVAFAVFVFCCGGLGLAAGS